MYTFSTIIASPLRSLFLEYMLQNRVYNENAMVSYTFAFVSNKMMIEMDENNKSSTKQMILMQILMEGNLVLTGA